MVQSRKAQLTWERLEFQEGRLVLLKSTSLSQVLQLASSQQKARLPEGLPIRKSED